VLSYAGKVGKDLLRPALMLIFNGDHRKSYLIDASQDLQSESPVRLGALPALMAIRWQRESSASLKDLDGM
jgi:hypothetical protein